MVAQLDNVSSPRFFHSTLIKKIIVRSQTTGAARSLGSSVWLDEKDFRQFEIRSGTSSQDLLTRLVVLSHDSDINKLIRQGPLISLIFFRKYRGFSRRPCWRAETMKQFCMKIDLISQGRENVLFMPSNMDGNDVTWKCSIAIANFLCDSPQSPGQMKLQVDASFGRVQTCEYIEARVMWLLIRTE